MRKESVFLTWHGAIERVGRALLRSEDIIRRPIELDGVGAQHVTQHRQDVEVFEIVVVLRPAETPCFSAFPYMFVPSLS